MTMGPGGGSDPGNAGRGGSSSGRGSTGGGGFGRDTPGSPDAPGGKRGSNLGPGGGTATSGGPGNDTPGRPDSVGRRSNDRMSDTPGDPSRPGRRGKHAVGTTARSRAKDALERNARGIGASRGDLLRSYEKQGQPLNDMESRMMDGIRAGETNQTIANRVTDFFSMFGLGMPAGLIADAVTDMQKPADAHPDDYGEGQKEANDRELGIFGTSALGYGMSKLGKTAPIGMINSLQASVRRAIDDPNNVGTSPSTSTQDQSPGLGGGGNGKARTAIAAMSKSPGMTGTRPPGNAFGWSPVDIDRYSRTPLALARNDRG